MFDCSWKQLIFKKERTHYGLLWVILFKSGQDYIPPGKILSWTQREVNFTIPGIMRQSQQRIYGSAFGFTQIALLTNFLHVIKSWVEQQEVHQPFGSYNFVY